MPKQSSAGATVLQDEDGDACDWIELHNLSGESVQLLVSNFVLIVFCL